MTSGRRSCVGLGSHENGPPVDTIVAATACGNATSLSLNSPSVHRSIFIAYSTVSLQRQTLSFRRLIGFSAVDHPGYAEAIDDHAKASGPERFLERHHNPAVLRQFVKDPLGVRRALDMKRERETLGRLIAIRRDVATHQHLAAEGYAAVHNFVLPVGRNLIRQGRPGVTKDPRSSLPAASAIAMAPIAVRALAASLSDASRRRLPASSAAHRPPATGSS